MEQVLLFALLGLGTGALIAGIALGLVIMYRGSGIINLAMGATAMVAAYAFWSLNAGIYGYEFSIPTAFVLALLVSLTMGVLMEVLAFRPLRTASPLAKLVASLGILLVTLSAVLVAFGPEPKTAPTILPSSTFEFLNVRVPVSDLILAGIVIVIAVVLIALYGRTRFGLATQAAAENEVSALLVGLSSNRLAMANTLLASLVVGALGVLVAPLTSIESQALPLQVVPALAAALFANFTSIGIACAAGLGIGALQNIVYYVSTQSWFPTDHGVALPGVQALLVFLLIVVALFVRGTRLPQRGELVEQGLPAVPRPDRLLRPALIGTVATAAALVVFPFDFRQALVNTIIAVVLILSLVVMTGFVGQISIVQLALSGVSGFVISHVARDLGIGFPLGAVIGIGVATVLGIAIAASALRVRGVQLAVVTLAATVAIEEFWFANTTWGAGATGTGVPEPKIFGLDLGTDASFRGVDGKLPSPILGLVVLGVGVLLCMLVANLRRTNLGQRMLAVRSNERAAAAIGINVRNVKLAAFGLSSFIAGVAGAMYAYNFGSVSASRFTVLTAFGVIAFAYVGGITMVTGAMIAALLSTEALFPHALDAWFGVSGTWFLLFGACGLIFNLVLYPDGIAGGMYRKRQLRKRAQENGIRRKSLVQAVTRGRMSPTRTGEP